MPKTKVMVRVLYPTAFQPDEMDEAREKAKVEPEHAKALVAAGYAEYLKPPAGTRKEA